MAPMSVACGHCLRLMFDSTVVHFRIIYLFCLGFICRSCRVARWEYNIVPLHATVDNVNPTQYNIRESVWQ